MESENRSLILNGSSQSYGNNEDSTSIKIDNLSKDKRKLAWGATPSLRTDWISKRGLQSLSVNTNEENSVNDPIRYNSLLQVCLNKFPGLMIAVILNLFLSISFGNAFFPSYWDFPSVVPRSIGVQMWLFSTFLCQIFMTSMSDFPCAQGMMMVENIPFMHTIAQVAIKHQGMGIDTFSTVFVAFALSSIIVGILFLVLGIFKLGNSVYYFPRHVIIGCIGGIGIFLILTSIEISTSVPWEWSSHNIQLYFKNDINKSSSPYQLPPYLLGLPTLGFEIVLIILLRVTKLSMLPPFYFVTIPPIFYLILLPIRYYHPGITFTPWFFPSSSENVNVLLIWKLINFHTVNWTAIGELIPTIISLTIFSLMHVPINIPSLSLSTEKDVDMNKELITHGVSNIVTGVCGGLQNYLCYSNSLLYFKCKGGGMVSGYLLTAITGIFFCIGPSVVSYIPRCMAGCIIFHIGIELTKEALVDSLQAFDIFEYLSVLLITIVMTFYGMTAGLALGVLNAAFTFTLQNSKHVPPIKEFTRATTLRSSRWRSPLAAKVLETSSRHILVVQLQGQLFFANAIQACTSIQSILAVEDSDVWYMILDFTQVLGIDSSAADRLAKLLNICRKYKVKVVYSRGSRKGFPCAAPLSEQLFKLEQESINNARLSLPTSMLSPSTNSSDMHVTDSLDEALAWCENDLIVFKAHLKIRPNEPEKPSYLRHFYTLCGNEPDIVKDKLFGYFRPEYITAGAVVWRQGDLSDKAMLLAHGRLVSYMEGEEEKTTEIVDAGFVLGEFGLLTDTTRRSTVRAETDASVFVLTREQFDIMVQQDAYLGLVLSRICMTYLDHRVQHVANRLWGNHSVPI